jgi:hypothetical protein
MKYRTQHKIMAIPTDLNTEWNKLTALVDGDDQSLVAKASGHRFSFEFPDWHGYMDETDVNDPMRLPTGYQMYVFYRGRDTYLHHPFRTKTDAMDAFMREIDTRCTGDYEVEFWTFFFDYAIKLWYVIHNIEVEPQTEEDLVVPDKKEDIVEIFTITWDLILNGSYQGHEIPTDDGDYEFACRHGSLKIRVFSLPVGDYEMEDLNTYKNSEASGNPQFGVPTVPFTPFPKFESILSFCEWNATTLGRQQEDAITLSRAVRS